MKRTIVVSAVICAMLMTFAACGKAPAADVTGSDGTEQRADIVSAQSVDVTTDNNGEDAQHVNFIIGFDGDLSTMKAEDFTASVADDPIKAEDIALAVSGNTATVTLTVFAVKGGNAELSYTGGSARPFTIEAVVSPGMDLETVEQDKDAASVTVRVSELFHVRGIARVMLLENGEVVETKDDKPSQFTAIHGHDFLELDAETIAEKIVFGLSESYPEGYSFSADGASVTAVKTDNSSPAELELKIQHWERLENS